MKALLTILALCVTFSTFAKSPSSRVTLIKCAQDVVDYGIGGSQGLSFSAQTLEDLEKKESTVAELLESCINFQASHEKSSPDREQQILELNELRHNLSPNAYFFLRGVIRPLITCRPAGVLNKCESATGKRWMETVIFDQRRTKNHYRMGHSQQGLMVRGIVGATSEDLEYLDSLPENLKSDSQDSLLENEGARYLRFKVMKLKGSLKFIKHYF